MMRMTFLLLAASLVACGGTTDPPNPGSAGTGSTGGGSEGGGSGGSVSATDAGTSGSLAGGNAGSTSVALEDQPLLPLVPGHVSSFVFSPIDESKPMTDTCPTPTTAVESADGLSFDGHVGALYRTFCADQPFLVEGHGDDLTAYELKDGKVVLPSFSYIHSPVETGQMWESGRGDRYTWQAATGPIETPAGTFEACWHREGRDTQITYCRGVGVVQALGAYGNYQLDLVKKNF
jgi:hypothetical protein